MSWFELKSSEARLGESQERGRGPWMDVLETLSCSSTGSCAQVPGNVPEKLLVDTSSDVSKASWFHVLGSVPVRQVLALKSESTCKMGQSCGWVVV